MSRRPLCIIGCLVILILWSLNLMGVSTFGGTSLDLTDSDRSVIIQGILYKQESNSFYTSLYLKKTNLIQNSKKQSIDNVKATIKTEYLKQLPSDGDRLLIQGRLKQIQEPGNPGQFNERSYYYARKIKWYLEAEQVTIQKTEADKGVTFRSRLKELFHGDIAWRKVRSRERNVIADAVKCYVTLCCGIRNSSFNFRLGFVSFA